MVIITLCLMLLLSSSNGRLGNPEAPRASLHRDALPPLAVTVFAPSDMSESLVNRICAETDAIWEPAGVAFEWRRIRSSDAARTWQLEVTIDDRRKGTPWESQTALGWIPFTAARPEPSIHLSRASVEDLFLRTTDASKAPIITHETLVGRALGRALSHELGHYLLNSKLHTPRGVMRAVWPWDEFFTVSRGGFELTAKEREAAAQHVQEDKLTEGAPRGED